MYNEANALPNLTKAPITLYADLNLKSNIQQYYSISAQFGERG